MARITFNPPEKQDDGTTLVWADAVSPHFTEKVGLIYGFNIADQIFVSAWAEISEDTDVLVTSTDDEPLDLSAGVFDLDRTEDITLDYEDSVEREIALLDLIVDFAAYHDTSSITDED